jgi:hypothetical protein
MKANNENNNDRPRSPGPEVPARAPVAQGKNHPPELQALLLAAEGAGPDVQERIVRAYYAEMEGAADSVAVYQSILLVAVYNAIRHDVKNAAAALPPHVREAAAAAGEPIRQDLRVHHDQLRKDLQTQTGDLVRRETALAAKQAQGWQREALNYGAIGLAALLLGGWLVYFFDAKRVSDAEAQSEARSEERVRTLMRQLPDATRLQIALENRGGGMELQGGVAVNGKPSALRLVIHHGKDTVKEAYRDSKTGDAVVVFQ